MRESEVMEEPNAAEVSKREVGDDLEGRSSV